MKTKFIIIALALTSLCNAQSFTKTIKYLMDNHVLGNFILEKDISKFNNEFENNNEFTISFKSPDNDSRPINFSKISSKDDIKLIDNGNIIEFKVDNQIRYFYFPRLNQTQLYSSEIKNIIFREFVHIKELLEENKKPIVVQKQSETIVNPIQPLIPLKNDKENGGKSKKEKEMTKPDTKKKPKVKTPNATKPSTKK